MLIQALAAIKSKDKLITHSYEITDLKPYKVLIQISHCGICYSDIHLINND